MNNSELLNTSLRSVSRLLPKVVFVKLLTIILAHEILPRLYTEFWFDIKTLEISFARL